MSWMVPCSWTFLSLQAPGTAHPCGLAPMEGQSMLSVYVFLQLRGERMSLWGQSRVSALWKQGSVESEPWLTGVMARKAGLLNQCCLSVIRAKCGSVWVKQCSLQQLNWSSSTAWCASASFPTHFRNVNLYQLSLNFAINPPAPVPCSGSWACCLYVTMVSVQHRSVQSECLSTTKSF